jgi:hypothetical protein
MRNQNRPSFYRERLGFAMLFLLGALLIACSSCAANQYPDNVPTMSDPAVVELVMVEKGVVVSGCTAWKLDSTKLMTAGHCCEPEYTYLTRGPHAVPGTIATALYDDDEHDVCVLKGQALGAPIRLAERDPIMGAAVWTAGYPQSQYLISSGYWSGRDSKNRCKASVAVWGGASGSVIMDSRGYAVGLLVAYRPPMSNLAYCTPLEWMKIAKTMTELD